ncbi:hypothetical protein BG910_03235 [Neisseria chenwenguii]|uniref:Uncharacterized protein n=1 Tax=Neisseria chenwenguii TaxID=1853278 RepID=A0A220S0B3_9NEIS|nr:hypothetical protein [Neisseria chenwenguii]ASK26887.1 hypothetical protein BG910_03235 [Neisseria chenwenguii]
MALGIPLAFAGGGGNSDGNPPDSDSNAGNNAAGNSQSGAAQNTPSAETPQTSDATAADGAQIPAPEQPEIHTTRILYKDGIIVTRSAEAGRELDLSVLEYREAGVRPSEKNEIIRNKPSDESIAYLNGFVSTHVDSSKDNLQASYKADTDGDGLIDSKDRYPDMWNVSDRDLRMFSTLAYATEGKTAMQQAFDGVGSIEIDSVKADLNGQVDISEYQGHWDVLSVVSKGEFFGSGLDYTIFGNGKKADGSYQNIVVAFRGTKGLQDATAGLKLAQGNTPTQAKQMDEIISTLEQYNPDHVYSTGHSLGGYLAQYFATYTVQNSQFKDEFVRSVLFNTAKIITDGSPTPDLVAAAARSEQFAQERIYDARFTNQSGVTYKTNSYVIEGEWLSSGDVPTTYQTGAAVAATAATAAKGAATGGFLALVGGLVATIATGGAAAPLILAGAKAGAAVGGTIGGAQGAGTVLGFDGLGTYKNTIFLKNTAANKDGWDKHALANFYETSTEVQKYFSQGYRVDKNQKAAYEAQDFDRDGLNDYDELRIDTSAYTNDTDGDGFSDGLEAKLGSDGTKADVTPYATASPAETADLRPITAVVQTEDSDGNVVSTKAVELTATQEADGTVVYRPSENAAETSIDLGKDKFDWSAFGNQTHNGEAVLLGTSGDETLTGSSGSDRLLGSLGSDTVTTGAGRDTVVFSAEDIREGKTDRITDFDITEDRLDLSGLRSLFGDAADGFDWGSVFGDRIVFDNQAHTLAYRDEAGVSTVFAQFDNGAEMTAVQIIG